MKSIFDRVFMAELANRINTLNENSTAQWGKMNVYQMAKHCKMWQELIMGKIMSKRVFIGRVIGRMALNNVLKNEKPLRKSSRTIPELIIKEQNGDLEKMKQEWIELLEESGNFSTTYFIHPFFGKMTKGEIGYFGYKHNDHHLRQFNS